MKLAQLKALVRLVEHDLNITRTAESLFTAQSAISRYIQLLEHELNSPLFERNGKRLLHLTKFGEKVVEHGRKIIHEEKYIVEMAKDQSDPQTGLLRIATTHTQAKYFLPDVIRTLRKKYPKVVLKMQQTSPSEIVRILENQLADIGVCTEAIGKHSNLICKDCYSWQHAAIVPRDHKFASATKLSLEDFHLMPVITYVPGFTGREALQMAFEEKKIRPNVVLSATDTDVIKTYVRLGFGAGIIANMAFSQDKDLDLILIPLEGSPTSVTQIAWHRSIYMPQYMRDAIEIIKQKKR